MPKLTFVLCAVFSTCVCAPADLFDNALIIYNNNHFNQSGLANQQVSSSASPLQPLEAFPSSTGRVTSANDIDSSHYELLKNNETKSEVPVHQRYPHAVLFSLTCGGSIISSKWVITAAHCTLFQRGRHVLAGTSTSDNGSGVYRAIKRRILHPLFTVGPYWLNAKQFGIKQVMAKYDYMLAELEEPLPLDGVNIAAIPLDDTPSHPSGEEVGLAGYGAAFHGDTMRHNMHELVFETIDDEECARRFVEFDKRDMICTKGQPPRNDYACNGDSGSGVMGKGKLIGVASWVEDDAITCRPGTILVFSRIASVRDWIRQVTGI